MVGCCNSGCELAGEYGSKPSIVLRGEFASLSRQIGRLIQYAASGIAPLLSSDISSRISQKKR